MIAVGEVGSEGAGKCLKRPNGLAFSRRERAAQDCIKKGTILRAKRSDWNALFGGSRLGRDVR